MKKIFTRLITLMTILMLTGTCFSAETFTYKPYDGNGELYDLEDLDHSYAYKWEINLGAKDFYGNFIDTSQIVGAKLVFDDLHNWNDSYNILHVSALDPNYTSGGSDPVHTIENNTENNQGVVSIYDDLYGDADIANFFINANGFTNAELLFQIEDLDPVDVNDTNPLNVVLNYATEEEEIIIDNVDYNNPATLTVQANTLGKLTNYISNNILTLGFDPDCHFYNTGIALVLTTEVPTNPGSSVPEPETLLLFGLGLIGVSAFGRKRMNMGGEIS